MKSDPGHSGPVRAVSYKDRVNNFKDHQLLGFLHSEYGHCIEFKGIPPGITVRAHSRVLFCL